MTFLDRIQEDDTFRREQFPTAAKHRYMAHAGVAPLPRVAVPTYLRISPDFCSTFEEIDRVVEVMR